MFHTLGSHFRYNYRYTKNFEEFKPVINDNFSIGDLNVSNKEKLVNSYDNSILYTDFVLNEFIQKLKINSTSSLLMYLSDHGENLFDEDDYILHGNSKPTKYELNVPLIIWTSNSYKEKNVGIINALVSNLDKNFSSVNLCYLMWGLSGIDFTIPYKNTLLDSNYIESDTIYAYNDKLFAYPVSSLEK